MAAPAEHDKLAEVVEAGTAIARGLDLDDTLRAVVEAAARVTGAAYGALGVLGPDRRISRFITTGLSDEERERLGSLPTGRGILGVLIDESRPLRLTDLSDDPRSVGFPPNHPPMRSFLGVPVAGRGAVYGNLYLTEAPHGAFTDEDERIAVLLAGMAAVAIENARLYQDATEKAEQAQRAADARMALTAAAAAVLHEHDLMEALRLRRPRGGSAPARAPRRRCHAGRVRRTDPLRDRRRRGRGDLRHLGGPPRRFLRRIGAARGRPIHVDGRNDSALGSFATAKRLAGHDVIAQPVIVGDRAALAVILAVGSRGRQRRSPRTTRSCSRRSPRLRRDRRRARHVIRARTSRAEASRSCAARDRGRGAP